MPESQRKLMEGQCRAPLQDRRTRTEVRFCVVQSRQRASSLKSSAVSQGLGRALKESPVNLVSICEINAFFRGDNCTAGWLLGIRWAASLSHETVFLKLLSQLETEMCRKPRQSGRLVGF